MGLPDVERLRATIERLAAFHTRNTLSAMHREAAEWIASEYRAIGLEVEIMPYTLSVGKRVEEPTEAVQVLATLPGRSPRRIILSAHFDSLNLTQDQRTGRAPGANDDGSGIAACLEVARLMVERRWEHTVVFAALSGEEQGLCGARALAERARAESWIIDAVLNNDMVGNGANLRGMADRSRVRVFSDSQSRELARWIEWLVRREAYGFGVKLVLRHDRFGRGGDHTPMNQAGYAAVRITETIEEYARQHTVDDLPEYVDFEYLANVARANLIAAQALASAAAPPTTVTATRENGHDTRVTWEGPDGTLLWRDTASAGWEHEMPATAGTVLVEGVTVDDHVFAVTTGGIPVPMKE